MVSPQKTLNLIVCHDMNYGIGKNGSIPWHLPKDLKHFRKITSQQEGQVEPTVIMGYTTWKSLPSKQLPNRHNIVLTRSHLDDPNLPVGEKFTVFDCLHKAIKSRKTGDIFIIGGTEIYKEFLTYYEPYKIYITHIKEHYQCDTFFPMDLIDQSKYVKLSYPITDAQTDTDLYEYTYQNKDEQAFLDLFKTVIDTGNHKGDRTGTGTISLFSPTNLEFDLSNNRLPFTTSKQFFSRQMIDELLWFISGSTDSKELEKRKTTIWVGNTSREFLDKSGPDKTGLRYTAGPHKGKRYFEGDLGPGYGFQWRHFGATYRGCRTMEDHEHPDCKPIGYKGEGVDQLANIIYTLRNNPNDRRILMSAWNPADLDKMALPPCHILYQLYVHENNKGEQLLSAKMYQRSADSFLGVCFNIGSYALLTHMIAELVGMKADRMVMTFGDYHIYNTHLDVVRQQIERIPLPPAKVMFKRNLTGLTIDDIERKDFEVLGYTNYGALKAPMSI